MGLRTGSQTMRPGQALGLQDLWACPLGSEPSAFWGPALSLFGPILCLASSIAVKTNLSAYECIPVKINLVLLPVSENLTQFESASIDKIISMDSIFM